MNINRGRWRNGRRIPLVLSYALIGRGKGFSLWVFESLSTPIDWQNMNDLDYLKDRIKDLSTYFHSLNVLYEIKQILASRYDVQIEESIKSMQKYGIDLRGRILPLHNIAVRVSILNEEIKAQAVQSIDDYKRMKDSVFCHSDEFIGMVSELESWDEFTIESSMFFTYQDEEDVHYWTVKHFSTDGYEEIPKYLYDALDRYIKERGTLT